MSDNVGNNNSRIVLFLTFLTIVISIPSAYIAYKQIIKNKQVVRLSFVANDSKVGYKVMPKDLDSILVVYNIDDSLFNKSNIRGYYLPFPFSICNIGNTYIHDISISLANSSNTFPCLLNSKTIEIIKPSIEDTIININTLRDTPYDVDLNYLIDRNNNQKIQSFCYCIKVSQDNFPSKTINIINVILYNSNIINSRDDLTKRIKNVNLNFSNYDILFFDCKTNHEIDSTGYVSCENNCSWFYISYNFFSLSRRYVTLVDYKEPKILKVIVSIIIFLYILIAIQLFILIDLRKKYTHLSLEDYMDLFDDTFLKFCLKKSNKSVERVLKYFLIVTRNALFFFVVLIIIYVFVY